MSAITRTARRSTVSAVVAFVLAAAVVVPVLANQADAVGGTLSCSGAFQIDEDVPGGGHWSMCWELRDLEGVVLHDVTYTPPGGDAVEVLGSMNLSQIHVPYDNNWARFHDESDFGLGFNLESLDAGDCPDGELLSDGTNNVLCQQTRAAGYDYKSYDDQAQGSTLSLFSVSAIGAYNYVVAWNFDGDGTIRPEVGATGQLQLYGGDRSTGWPVGEGSIAVAHMHNFYWRLDFDVNGPAHDQVQELDATFNGARDQLSNSRVPFHTEAARRVSPRSMRSWRVRDLQTGNADGHPISYQLLPSSDFIFRGPPAREPFTQNEFYATRLNNCERFASHNPRQNNTCGGNLAAFANGGTLDGADLVVWYGTSFHHLPRDEDEPHMSAHWSGFSIVPRDLTATHAIP
jgi:primary-amine oxidase